MGLLTSTYNGVPSGSNLAVPAHEIKDTEARYVQDGLLDQVGLLRRRGPVSAVSTVATFSNPAQGLVQTNRPDGTHSVGVLNGVTDTSAFLGVLSSDYTSYTNVPWNGVFTVSPYHYVDAKSALGGGVLIGTSKQASSVSPVQSLGFWQGAGKLEYTTGTVTVVRGSTAVTGSGTSWSSNVDSGMFLFATATSPAVTAYFGVVRSVNSNTSLTLTAVSPWAASAAAYSLKSFRGVCPKYSSGRVTTATTTSTVTGFATKFKDNSLDSGNWALFRASDMGFIGNVSAVTNNNGITLSANSALALDNESFVALKADGDYSLSTQSSTRTPGFVNAVYSSRQFYANNGRSPEDTFRVWFSGVDDPESLDLDPTEGDFLEVTSSKIGSLNTPILALVPAYNSLLVLKETESFAVVGNTPDQYELRKLVDDGAISTMSVQQYEGGVLFAGKEGIYYYDGVNPRNITEPRLGDWYKKSVATFNNSTSRMWSLLDRDHYFLFIEAVTPPYKPRRGTTTATVTRLTICVFLPTMAVTFLQNVNLRGSVSMPSSTGQGGWYVVNTSSGARICSTNGLFDTEGNDTITCLGDTIGPDFYMESKRYAIADTLRRKLFKQTQLTYYADVGGLTFDTVVGLNEQGTTSSSNFARTLPVWDDTTALGSSWDALGAAYSSWDDLNTPRFKVKRIKFLKRSQLMGFRIYQENSSVTKVKLGPWAIGYKPQRAGRS